MAILVGVDEAGYGPILGPLVVAATAWHIDESALAPAAAQPPLPTSGAASTATATARAKPSRRIEPAHDLYKLLRRAVCRAPDKARRRLAIADSKALYSSALGLRWLETGVLASLAVRRRAGQTPDDFEFPADGAALFAATGADPEDRRRQCQWDCDDAQPLPIDAAARDLRLAATRLARDCRRNGASVLALRARFVFPAEYNELVDSLGNKATALSHITLQLVRRLLDELPSDVRHEPAVLFLDKHGGRNHYCALLQHHFPEGWIQAVSESRSESRYRWDREGAPVEARFRMSCEELLPTALASMTAKYHRELAMRAFNAYWTARIPELRPTAGYFADSRRFKAAIADMQRELGIEDRLLWRCR